VITTRYFKLYRKPKRPYRKTDDALFPSQSGTLGINCRHRVRRRQAESRVWRFGCVAPTDLHYGNHMVVAGHRRRDPSCFADGSNFLVRSAVVANVLVDARDAARRHRFLALVDWRVRTYIRLVLDNCLDTCALWHPTLTSPLHWPCTYLRGERGLQFLGTAVS